jgi:hypothetical protein
MSRRRRRKAGAVSSRDVGNGARPSLVAVRVNDLPTADRAEFELRIGSTKIGVPHGFDEEELARLLRVVSSC